jgi:hypothetical protein
VPGVGTHKITDMENISKNNKDSNTASRDTDRTFLSSLLSLKDKVVHEMIAKSDFQSKTYELLLAVIILYIEKEYHNL